jgi:hypothetical protein
MNQEMGYAADKTRFLPKWKEFTFKFFEIILYLEKETHSSVSQNG